MTETDNVWFTCLTLNTNPNHFNDEFSKGTPFGRPLVNSAFTLALVTGLTVPDTSENATANLAWTDITMPNPVYVGDTLWAETEVLDTRESRSRPNVGSHRRAHARDQPAPRGRHRVPPHLHGLRAPSTPRSSTSSPGPTRTGASEMSTVAERLAGFTSTLSADALPPEVAVAAKLHVLDTLGCGLAAFAVGVASGARDAMLEPGTTGPATAIGAPHGLPGTDAAFYNAVTCHALDFDDTHTGSIAHVSVAIVPAALAAAESEGRDGGRAARRDRRRQRGRHPPRHGRGAALHNVGFHPTAILGVFGATAAAARIMGLDAATTRQALGIAGSLAAGILENLADGSSTKRLHPGFAARSGILAARLAAHGETGPATVIEGRFGIYNAYLRRGDLDIDGQLSDLGERWERRTSPTSPIPRATSCTRR